MTDVFLTDKERLTHTEVLEHLHSRLPSFAMTKTETIPLLESRGRILSQDLLSPHSVPLHSNAAVDGYAFSHSDLSSSPLPISLTISAGDLTSHTLESGSAVRIFTGAILPHGADTIAMQEHCTPTETHVALPSDINKGSNCRLSGEDLRPNDIVIPATRRITSADIAAAASIGIDSVAVFVRPKVLLFSSGAELRSITDTSPLRLGEVWDTNAPMLHSLAHDLPIDLQFASILPDDYVQTRDLIHSSSSCADMIITTGGASYGDEDYMSRILRELGECHLWQLAIKPGRPMMMGQIPTVSHNCLYMGLPGNPVASFVCFLLYVRESLLLLSGTTPSPIPRFRLPSLFSTSGKKPDRREFRRGILVRASDGEYSVDEFPHTGSGLITSLRASDGLIELSEDIESVNVGDLVTFIPYTSFD